MKRSFLLLSLLIIFSLVAKGQEEDVDSDKVKTGDAMPAFTIVSDDGKQISSAEFNGQVLLVTMFATWCPPCQLKLAEIQQSLWPKFKDVKGFTLLVIGREHSDAELIEYNKTKGFTFTLYPDKDRKIFDLFAVQYIPRTYLINKDGKIIFMTTGFNPEEFQQLGTMIERALNQ